MKNSSKKSVNAFEKLADKLRIPKSVYGDAVEIMMENNNKMYINDHSGLFCADKNLIVIKGPGNMVINIAGTDLCVNAISDTRAFITGNIKDISF